VKTADNIAIEGHLCGRFLILIIYHDSYIMKVNNTIYNLLCYFILFSFSIFILNSKLNRYLNQRNEIIKMNDEQKICCNSCINMKRDKNHVQRNKMFTNYTML
jgi:hypothetical protein